MARLLTIRRVGNTTAEAYWAIYVVQHSLNDEALQWAKKSEAQGDPHGAWSLSKFHENGVGTPVDQKKVAQWRTIALNDPEFHALSLKAGYIHIPPPHELIASVAPYATPVCDTRISEQWSAK